MLSAAPAVPSPCAGPIHQVARTATRARSLADCALFDVTEAAVAAGFTIPVAVTCAVYDDCIVWTIQDSRRQVQQDMAGRLRNVLSTLACHARVKRPKPTRELWFQVERVPRNGCSISPQPVWLKALIHAGDAGEAVLTVMLADEED